MRITEQEQEIRRDRMLHEAFNLFSKYGIDDVSLSRIAKAANVSSKSIFRYFDSKASLLQQTQDILWKEIINYLSDTSQEAASIAENGLEELRIQLYGFENLYKYHSNYILFAYEYKAYLIRNELKIPSGMNNNTIRSVSPLFLNALLRGQADGSIMATESATSLFLKLWYSMRHFIEQLVVYDRIYHGESPWGDVFPFVIARMIDYIKAKDHTTEIAVPADK